MDPRYRLHTDLPTIDEYLRLRRVSGLTPRSGQGPGKAIVASLMEALRTLAPAEAYTCLIADGRANELYAQYGFEPTAPASIAMAQWLGR